MGSTTPAVDRPVICNGDLLTGVLRPASPAIEYVLRMGWQVTPAGDIISVPLITRAHD
ncbi:hypothetical protein ABZ543_13185 [Streptomyces roseifaciens]